MIVRANLTAGSTWHAAVAFHAPKDNPNVAARQNFTIDLYREVEAESGQSVGLHKMGSLSPATNRPEVSRMATLKRVDDHVVAPWAGEADFDHGNNRGFTAGLERQPISSGW